MTIPPNEAVTRKQGKRIVNVLLPDGKTEERVVESGINDGAKVEIVSGLEIGDKVVLQKAQAESRWRAGEGGKQGGFNPGKMMGGGGKR